MAKRPIEDEDDDIPKVRKRRYKPKKADDDDDASSPPGRDMLDDDDEGGERGISTGNVYLDIALDFRDDCIDWSKEHVFYAATIGTTTFLVAATLVFLLFYSWSHYLNRPSLETVIKAYDFGAFPETKLLADYALQYISQRDPEVRSPFLFLQGAALCAIAERESPANKQDYYLIAANYLKEAAVYNFLPSRVNEGWFLLGKSLFHSGELEQCRDPFLAALDKGYPRTKEIYWYLANAYLLGASPDLNLAYQYLKRFQDEPTVLEEEIAESRLLETIITLHIDGIIAAEEICAKVPRFRQFDLMRNFAEGQIEFFKARALRQEAIDFEKDPNPSLLRTVPIALPPVRPEPVLLPMETPTALVPVVPMDEETLRTFMLPAKPLAPVLGQFDETSVIQQQIAEMRSPYTRNLAEGDEVIVLPRDDSSPAPEPPQPTEIPPDPFGGDPILKRIQELRDKANIYYRQSIGMFSEVIRLSDAVNPWGRTARLLTGIGYIEMGEPRNAENHLRTLIEAFPNSSEAAAAGFLLGERAQTLGNSGAAFRSFAQVFDNLRRNDQYVSLWMPKEMIVERCGEMVRADIEKQNYTEAVTLLDMLGGVMHPAEIARLRGETYESWATLLQSQAEVTFGDQGHQLSKEAESKWRSAGAAWETQAQLSSDTPDFSPLLWRSAESYRIGKDYRRAVIEYKKFIAANLRDHRPEVNLRLGEMYLNLDVLADAAYVLEEALRDFPTHPLVPQIRLVLSYVHYERKEWEKAADLLKLNLVGEAAPTSASYRDAMYALGEICSAQGDWDSAIPYLENALKIHPDALQAAEANYTLAKAYLQLAENLLAELAENPPEAVRRDIESQVQSHRYRAMSYLERTEHILADRQRVMGLTVAERLMLRNVHFAVCTLLLRMEQYEQAIRRLNMVATMYHDQPEALDALYQMVFALRMIGRDAEAQTALRQAEVILNQLEKIGTISDGVEWRTKIQGQMRR